MLFVLCICTGAITHFVMNLYTQTGYIYSVASGEEFQNIHTNTLDIVVCDNKTVKIHDRTANNTHVYKVTFRRKKATQGQNKPVKTHINTDTLSVIGIGKKLIVFDKINCKEYIVII